jgi:hypothetical protein
MQRLLPGHRAISTGRTAAIVAVAQGHAVIRTGRASKRNSPVRYTGALCYPHRAGQQKEQSCKIHRVMLLSTQGGPAKGTIL